ncbi:MAG: DUF4058 family protein, partial [Chloroflexi bacterium]|nr:DUF4058 family protein [Chloroflexota bacterium]
PDVHQTLATQMRAQIAPQIAPRYVARVTVRFAAEELGEEEIRIVLPDVEVLRPHLPLETGLMNKSLAVAIAGASDAPVSAAQIAPAPVVLPLPIRVRVPLSSVEIRETASHELVTSIEILSPVNKRGEGWREYQERRRKVLGGGAHLLEIDLLRRGQRAIDRPNLPPAPYLVSLTRASQQRLELWPLGLREPLPAPLRPPDADAPLDLGHALTALYDQARYDLSIDYRQPPNPPLSGDDAAWAAELIAARRPASA